MLLWAVPGRENHPPALLREELEVNEGFFPSLPHPLLSLKVWNDSGRLLEAEPQLLC